MAAQSTSEEPSEPATAEVVLLCYVLCFDDLLADGAVALRWPGGSPAITLGRAADDGDAGFRERTLLGLPDRFASSAHATIERSGSAHVLIDQGSRNGSFVNGLRIERQRLEDGDLIEVGHSLVCFRKAPLSLASALLDAPEPPLFGPTRTRSVEVAALVRDLGRIAPTRQSVLLLGESGAGKEAAARMVHERSGRGGAFRPVDCGAVPEGLFESTLFGHRRGAFTGATEPRTGEVKLADGGTLFLDEVANTSLAAQAKLLRVLEEGRFTPLGASAPLEVDVRWIAATNANVLGAESAFRQDLLQRLAGYVGRVPPLRRRREDLGTLTAYLLRNAGVPRASITLRAARRLFNDGFTGNVRQLRNVLQSAAVLAADGPIDSQHLASTAPFAAPPPNADTESSAAPSPRRTSVPAPAKVEEALRATRGNVVHAAELLGVHPRQLYRWMDRFELSVEAYRK